MKRIAQTLTVTGATNPVIMNNYDDVMQTGVQFTVTGTVSYTLQMTCDDVTSPTFSGATAQWQSVTGVVASGANGYYSMINQPCTAIRTSGSVAAGGSLTIAYIQPSDR